MEDAIKMRVGGQGAIVTGKGLEGGKQRLPPRVFFLVFIYKRIHPSFGFLALFVDASSSNYGH